MCYNKLLNKSLLSIDLALPSLYTPYTYDTTERRVKLNTMAIRTYIICT